MNLRLGGYNCQSCAETPQNPQVDLFTSMLFDVSGATFA